jgi:hypothetical protein
VEDGTERAVRGVAPVVRGTGGCSDGWDFDPLNHDCQKHHEEDARFAPFWIPCGNLGMDLSIFNGFRIE